jgi:hypothetical protein
MPCGARRFPRVHPLKLCGHSVLLQFDCRMPRQRRTLLLAKRLARRNTHPADFCGRIKMWGRKPRSLGSSRACSALLSRQAPLTPISIKLDARSVAQETLVFLPF